MMTRLQYLLGKLAEEAGEAAQMALKCQQFGMDEVQPGREESNKERLHAEMNDFNGLIMMLNHEFNLDYTPSVPAMQRKRDKVNRYYDLSAAMGLTEPRKPLP